MVRKESKSSRENPTGVPRATHPHLSFSTKFFSTLKACFCLLIFSNSKGCSKELPELSLCFGQDQEKKKKELCLLAEKLEEEIISTLGLMDRVGGNVQRKLFCS